MFKLCIVGDIGFEFWKDIPEFEGYYQVSTYGRVRSVDRNEEGHYRNGDFNAKYFRKSRILKESIKKGYPCVVLQKKGICKYYGTHRLVAITFLPSDKDRKYVDHIIPIRNGGTARVENLRWCTVKENCNNIITKKNKKDCISWCYRKVVCSNDKETYHFESIDGAAAFFKMKSSSSITNCLCGKAKTGYGYRWAYDD